MFLKELNDDGLYDKCTVIIYTQCTLVSFFIVLTLKSIYLFCTINLKKTLKMINYTVH